MSEISTDDLKEGIAQRGDDGELIPETHEIDWFGTTKVVKTKPITTGLLNELSSLDSAIADLEPQAVYEAFQTIYVTESVLNLTVADIDDMKGKALTSLIQPLEDAVEDNFGDGEGNPKDMTRNERAREMR